MPQGLEIYNSSGTLKFNSALRPSRIVSYFDSGVTEGSLTLPSDPNIVYFTIVIPSSTNNLCPPNAVATGNVVTWGWAAPAGSWRTSAMIIVGAM